MKGHMLADVPAVLGSLDLFLEKLIDEYKKNIKNTARIF